MAEEFDPWEFGPTRQAYNTNRYYTRSCNSHNHHTETRVKAAPEFVAILTKIVQDGKIAEYRSVADFWRDAAAHRLHWVLDNVLDDPDLRHQFTLEMRRDRLEALQTNRNRMYELVNDYRDKLEVGWDRDDVNMIRELLECGESDLDELDNPYRDNLETLLNEYYVTIGEERYNPVDASTT